MSNLTAILNIIKKVNEEISKFLNKHDLIQGLPNLMSMLINYQSIAIYCEDLMMHELDISYSTLSKEQNDSFAKLLKTGLNPILIEKKSTLIIEEFIERHLLIMYVESNNDLLILAMFRNTPYKDWEKDLIKLIKDRLEIALNTFSSNEKTQIYERQVVRLLSRTIEVRSHYTRGHSERVAQYAIGIARAKGLHEREVQIVKKAAMLHDIGKVGVPDSVLNNPGALSVEEYEQIKRHSSEGARILEALGFFQDIVPYVLYHHERYDGNGYPTGLKGESIPLEAQIIAVADTLDALTSDRVYRKALPWNDAIEEIIINKESQFSPSVVDAFLKSLDQPEMLIYSKDLLKV